LDPKKSLSPEDISPRVLKETCIESADVLTYIFNQSLTSGIASADWPVANIFDLHRKGAKELPENYRPISLTSICSKILEHIVDSSISQFLSDNRIISPRQHGFRPGHSCETQLILSIDDWSKALDSDIRTDMAIFDFTKAFESVPHQRLIVKLQSYGIRDNTLAWISSFLMNHEQRVTINGSKSSWLPVTSGFPDLSSSSYTLMTLPVTSSLVIVFYIVP
jgi:Reverse transcriptase (RNA-dependent DNA polymerase)